MQSALDAAREEHLPLVAFAQLRLGVPGWDNQAIVDTWDEALEGSPALPAAADIVREVMAAGGRGLQARLLSDATAAANTMSVEAALRPRINRVLSDLGQLPVDALCGGARVPTRIATRLGSGGAAHLGRRVEHTSAPTT